MKLIYLFVIFAHQFGDSFQQHVITAGASFPWTIQESVKFPQELCFTCTGPVKIVSLSPSYCSSCFDTWEENNVNCLYYVPRTTILEYDRASTYTINVSCEDTGTAVVATVNLGVIPNFPPAFTLISGSLTVYVGTYLKKGQKVKSIPFVDSDDTVLSFSITEKPNNGFFRIDNKGDIYAVKDLNTFCEQETAIVSMTDHHNPTVYLNILFDPGSNTNPVLKDWNRVINYPENKRLDLFITDRLDKAGSCIVESSPAGIVDADWNAPDCPGGTDRSSRLYFLALEYNHEQDPPLNISLQYHNGNCPSNTRWLSIHWSDVPEKPTLELLKPEYIVNEGFVQVKPEYVLADEDQNEKHIFSFVGTPSGKFSIDINTGKIFTPAYVVANSEVDVYNFNVKVTDKDGLTSNTVSLAIRVSDVNDHPPVLETIPQSYEATECSSPQKFLTVTASDMDFGINKDFKFIAVKSGSLLMNEAGELYLIKAPIADQVDELTVQAVDKGEPPLYSKKLTVKLYGRACPTTTTLPTPPPTTTPPAPPPTTIPVTVTQRDNNGADTILKRDCMVLLIIAGIGQLMFQD